MKDDPDWSLLLNVLKVFDIDVINPESSEKIAGLDVNNSADVSFAVRELLLPEFATYTSSTRQKIIDVLTRRLADPTDTFDKIFREFSLDFQDDLTDSRMFMQIILNEIST